MEVLTNGVFFRSVRDRPSRAILKPLNEVFPFTVVNFNMEELCVCVTFSEVSDPGTLTLLCSLNHYQTQNPLLKL